MPCQDNSFLTGASFPAQNCLNPEKHLKFIIKILTMKTLVKLMLTAALSLFILGSLSAQDANVKDNVKTTTGTSVTPGKFVDNNNDGICDNATTFWPYLHDRGQLSSCIGLRICHTRKYLKS